MLIIFFISIFELRLKKLHELRGSATSLFITPMLRQRCEGRKTRQGGPDEEMLLVLLWDVYPEFQGVKVKKSWLLLHHVLHYFFSL